MNAVTSLTAPWVRTASSKELIGLNVRNPFRGAQIWRAWKPAGALAWWHGKAPAPVDGWIDIFWYFCAFILVHGQENIDSSSSLASLAFFVQGITGINVGHLTTDCSCPKLMQHWNQFQPSSWNSLDSTPGSSFSLQISPSCNYRCKGQFDIVSPANVCRAVCFRRIPQHMSLFLQCFPTGHGLNWMFSLLHVQSDSTSLLRSWDVFLSGRTLVFPVPTPALCNPLQAHNITRYGLCVQLCCLKQFFWVSARFMHVSYIFIQ